MSLGIINASKEQLQAWEIYTWQQACEKEQALSSLSAPKGLQISPKPYQISIACQNRLTRKAQFTHQAMAMLSALNEYDRQQVLEEVSQLTKEPYQKGAPSYWRDRNNRIIKSGYPFKGYHYKINIYVQPDGCGIVVRDIFFDSNIAGGWQSKDSHQRPMLYDVNRGSGKKYTTSVDKKEGEALKESWLIGNPVDQVYTEYAAINGMQNNLDKAPYLMGVHLDVAYPEADPKSYTLYHNPSEGMVRDAWECFWDTSPFIDDKSHNTKAISAVLRHQQKMGKDTKWVVHSQGAIIFRKAVEFHNRAFGTSLNRHTVAIHAPGTNEEKMLKALNEAGITVQNDRALINPFDFVPNILGQNTRSTGSSFWDCMRFMRACFSANGDNIGVSPHTLPYLGIRNFRENLHKGGYEDRVKYIDKVLKKYTSDN